MTSFTPALNNVWPWNKDLVTNQVRQVSAPLRQAYKAFAEKGSAKNALMLAEAWEQLYAVLSIIIAVESFVDKTLEPVVQTSRKRLQKLSAGLLRCVMAKTSPLCLERWAKTPGRTHVERRRLRALRDMCVSREEGPEFVRLAHYEKTAEVREKLFYAQLPRHVGIHLEGEEAASVAQELSVADRRMARICATERGKEGLFFVPGEDALRQAMYAAPKPALRQRFFQALRADPHRPHDYTHPLRLRQRLAHNAGLSSFSAWRHKRMACRDNLYLKDWMARGVEKVRPLAVWSTAVCQQNTHTPVTLTAQGLPYDLCELEYLQATGDAPDVAWQTTVDRTSFPWYSTLLKMLDVLLPVDGWRLQSRPQVRWNGSQTMVLCPLQHDAGHTASLWVAPFAPTSQAGRPTNSEASPQAILLNSCKKLDGSTSPVVLVELALSFTEKAFSWWNLKDTAHEMGHALHFLRLDTQGEFDAVCRVADDIAEMPSMLLEQAAYDPAFLARLVDKKAAPVYHTEAFWTRRLATVEHSKPLTFLTSLINAAIDLDGLDATTLKAWRQRASAIYQQAGLHASSSPERDHFIWTTAHAGLQISYLISEALVSRILPMHRQKPAPFSLVACRYKEWLDHHGRLGASRPASFARAWQQWTGETMKQSLEKGLSTLLWRVGKQAGALKKKR